MVIDGVQTFLGPSKSADELFVVQQFPQRHRRGQHSIVDIEQKHQLRLGFLRLDFGQGVSGNDPQPSLEPLPA